jgi:hypothetical protein
VLLIATISVNFMHTLTLLGSSLITYLRGKCRRGVPGKYLKKARRKMKKRAKKSVGVSQEDATEIRGDEESIPGEAGVVYVKEINVKKKAGKKEGGGKKRKKK